MSANNFILVKKNHKGTGYGVQECDADTGAEITFLGTYRTLEGAIDSAEEYCLDNEIEYGIKTETK